MVVVVVGLIPSSWGSADANSASLGSGAVPCSFVMCPWATAAALGANIQIQIIALAFRIIPVWICASTYHSQAKFWTGCRNPHFLRVPNYYALIRDLGFILFM